MAKVLEQGVEKGAKDLLEQLGVNLENFQPNVLAQVPIMATALLSEVDNTLIEYDAYCNPYIVTNMDERVSLAAAIIYQNKIFVYNRENKDLQNLNEKLDVIGAVGFGLSSGPFKWPVEMSLSNVKSYYFSEYYAEEKTDGTDDKKIVKMPIVVVELDSIEGIENHFIDIPEINDSQTAKLQAAIMAIKEQN